MSASLLMLTCHIRTQLTQVQRTVSGRFAALLRSIRSSVPVSVYQTLVTALVLSRLDYGNATLIGTPASLCRHLQSVLNAAARSVAGLRRSDHVTETLASLHWLCASERMQWRCWSSDRCMEWLRSIWSTTRYCGATLCNDLKTVW